MGFIECEGELAGKYSGDIAEEYAFLAVFHLNPRIMMILSAIPLKPSMFLVIIRRA